MLKKEFWSEEKGHLVSTAGTKRTGLDCGILLGGLHGLGPDHDTPRSSNWTANSIFSFVFSLQPGTCSPSRSVVSKMKI